VAISTPGIGSNLDINGIVAKLMQAEATPLTALVKKEASYQAKLSAFGTLSGSLGAFKDALVKLNTPSTFQSMKASVADSTLFSAATTAKAGAGSYSIDVRQLAQSQTLSATGVASTTTAIGTGKLVVKFGTTSVANTGTALDAAAAAGGIAAGALSINGTAIATGASTSSAKTLAEQINLAAATTGVTATAQASTSGSLGAFTAISGTAYRLDIGGINIINNAPDGTTAADIDTALSAASGTLAAAGIAVAGTAAGGDLRFTRADGGNIAVQESGAGTTGGFAAAIGIGTTKTFTGAVSLASPNPITIAGSNPAAAGFTAGTLSAATFTQDASQTSGEVTIDTTNNSLQGIRDAINKANLGVTATIVADGSASPHHLVLKSNKTGAKSSMQIEVQNGDAQGGQANLPAYDPGRMKKK